MDIELLNITGDVITRLHNVRNPEEGFNVVWKELWQADSWRGYVPPLIVEPTLAEVITESLVMIDEGAGRIRTKYLTSVPGQETTYQEKVLDATKYRDAGYPVDATPYPWVLAESTATGKTPTEAANFILMVKAQWIIKGSQIEGERMKGKTDVRLAATVTDALTIRNTTLRNLQAM